MVKAAQGVEADHQVEVIANRPVAQALAGAVVKVLLKVQAPLRVAHRAKEEVAEGSNF